MVELTDIDGTVYAIKTEVPTISGVDLFTILMRDEFGQWGKVLGGFSARRKGGVVFEFLDKYLVPALATTVGVWSAAPLAITPMTSMGP